MTGDGQEALRADLWSVCSVRQLTLCHAFHSFGPRFEFLNVAYCGGGVGGGMQKATEINREFQ